jgi:hypothetical protein
MLSLVAAILIMNIAHLDLQLHLLLQRLRELDGLGNKIELVTSA